MEPVIIKCTIKHFVINIVAKIRARAITEAVARYIAQGIIIIIYKLTYLVPEHVVNAH